MPAVKLYSDGGNDDDDDDDYDDDNEDNDDEDDGDKNGDKAARCRRSCYCEPTIMALHKFIRRA